MIRQSSPTCKI